MPEGLVELVQAVRAALTEFQPEAYSAEHCGVLVEELAHVEKVSAAARVRAAVRAGAAGVHRERGFADVSDWVGRVTGSTAGSAKAALDTAAALEDQPEINAALQAGNLSLAQARELVRTQTACPGSAAELLDLATRQSLKTLKEEARDRRVRAIDPEELHEFQHAAQTYRHWRTCLGNVAFAGEVPPEIGVPMMNRLDAETDRLWQQDRQRANQARSDGGFHLETESDKGGATDPLQRRRSAFAARAFARMLETGGKGKAHSSDLVIVCDLQAYRRGHAREGEPCHIIGGGPISVSLARELGRDAFLKAVLHDGERIDTIVHFGRRIPAVLRTALQLGPPPDFDGVRCSAPGCDRQYHIERDHIDPVANGGVTSFVNSQPLCWPHHRVKTERDRKAGLLRRRAGGHDPP